MHHWAVGLSPSPAGKQVCALCCSHRACVRINRHSPGVAPLCSRSLNWEDLSGQGPESSRDFFTHMLVSGLGQLKKWTQLGLPTRVPTSGFFILHGLLPGWCLGSRRTIPRVSMSFPANSTTRSCTAICETAPGSPRVTTTASHS